MNAWATETTTIQRYLYREFCVGDECNLLNRDQAQAICQQISKQLLQSGTSRNEVVAIFGDRGALSLLAAIGIMQAGAAFLALDESTPDKEIQRRLDSISVKRTVCHEKHVENLNRLNQGVKCIVIPESSLSSRTETGNSTSSTAGPLVEIHSEDLAYVVFTSGTTGAAKPIGITHGNLCNYIHGITERLGGKGKLKDLNYMSVAGLSVDLGYTSVFLGLMFGSSIYLPGLLSARDPVKLAELIHTAEIDVLKITPTHLAEALKHSDICPTKYLVLGGEPFRLSLLEELRTRFPQLMIFNHYGPAETCVGLPVHELTIFH